MRVEENQKEGTPKRGRGMGKERKGVEGQKEPPKGEKRSENGDGRVPRKENGVRVTPKGREPEERSGRNRTGV